MTTGGRRCWRGPRGGGAGARGEHDLPVPGTPADLTPDADPESVARAIALQRLTAAPRTRAQLADAMARKGVPDEVAEAVLDRFEEVRLVDDEDFARQWVQTRHAGRGLSRRALRHELRERGVAEETVRAAVDEIDADAELETARQLVRRRLPGMGSDDPVRRTRRLIGLLTRKGYSTSLAFRALRDVVGEQVPEACGGEPMQEEDVE
jgi:regulatory protein